MMTEGNAELALVLYCHSSKELRLPLQHVQSHAVQPLCFSQNPSTAHQPGRPDTRAAFPAVVSQLVLSH